ncbi:hypothetical protein [uncultured Clostridium sp.]|uniref:hypothetical protein n=1 Tax=uncultured Clostridium sp. TaxID=59620 RepID=UPI0025827ADC|nr:hypothetical protein [uncultured Clostridium sp.]
MNSDYLDIYAFNDKEKEILRNNENIITGKIKLMPKDIQVYFYLKTNEGEIGTTDLVRKCLIKQGFDVNSKDMFKPRKKSSNDGFYPADSFLGYGEYRVDSFNKSLNKLVKVGLVEKRRINIGSIFKAVVNK